MSNYNAVYFLQKPFTANTEQLGCYYFNVLQAVELCRAWNAAIVPLKMPLAPRDNTKVELNSIEHWSASILEIGSVDSREVLDYSNVKTLTFEEFVLQSKGEVFMTTDRLTVGETEFKKSETSKYCILTVPPRWDTQIRDAYVFYNTIYPTLPINHQILHDKIPEWYTTLSDRPFLGVHWRRGDRGNSILGNIGRRLWNSTEPDRVARYINKYLEQNPELDWVYVSTNSGSEYDRNILISLVKKEVRFFNTPVSTAALDRWKWDLTDLLLCSKACHLILSPGGLVNSSAFGRLMYAECLLQNPSDAMVNFIPLLM